MWGGEVMLENKLNRVILREAESIEYCSAMNKLNVGIVGITTGVGVSFITTSLARYLANTRKCNPAVVELGKPSIFDSIGIDKRFAGRDFFPFFKAAKEEVNIKGQKNMDEGINWIIRTPEEYNLNISVEQKLRLVNGIVSDIALCDLSAIGFDSFLLLKNMDQIIVVVDPLPSKMLEGYEMLQELKALELSGHAVLYIINKLNKGVNRREMMDFIKIKKPTYLPMVKEECIYTAEYNCKIPYSVGEIKSQIQAPIKEIIKRMKM